MFLPTGSTRWATKSRNRKGNLTPSILRPPHGVGPKNICKTFAQYNHKSFPFFWNWTQSITNSSVFVLKQPRLLNCRGSAHHPAQKKWKCIRVLGYYWALAPVFSLWCFLDALASLDFKLWVRERFTFLGFSVNQVISGTSDRWYIQVIHIKHVIHAKHVSNTHNKSITSNASNTIHTGKLI